MNLKTLSLIIPGLVAIVGNIVFFAIVKSRIDKSIERYKISYAGIYKEKIDIHKEILKQLFQLKSKIQQYQYSDDSELGKELFIDFNNFINYYTISQPFLRQEISNGLKTITKELQECFDDFYMHNSLSKIDGIEPKIRNETLKKFFDSGNKFKKNEPFREIEELLISEMKKDLNIETERHPYERRFRIRQRLPWILINLGIAKKGKNCEEVGAIHKWYKIDNDKNGCYYCKMTEKR